MCEAYYAVLFFDLIVAIGFIIFIIHQRPSMSAKSDMADRLNAVFDVSIDWSKMAKEDLEALLKIVEDRSLNNEHS